MVRKLGGLWHFTCGKSVLCQLLVARVMRTFSCLKNHSNSLVPAAIVLLSMGGLLLVFELGGAPFAVIFHGLCTALAIRFLMGESKRIKAQVRQRTLALQDLAYRDGLTGLPNRRFFHWYLEQYLPRIQQNAQHRVMATHVALFDLNGFKAVNDTHGHEAGDELLKRISDNLSAQLPTSAVLARLGGDEFVVLVRDHDNGRVLQGVLKMIRKSARSVLLYNGQRIQVSASIGVSSSFKRKPELGSMLREADQRMYHDKAAQRKKLTVSEHINLASVSVFKPAMNAELEI